ncbi:dynein assembly factor 3, axonemal-like [Centruroides sculpturatus]|uniref:dynein assembly factor 3, axonemal-like n=1 Tax=Centruroides sculpturatus TaxID=218467 RepID=UPI000C6DF87D|nr:dynein assembly factor 3, axonemal-like [Centruroides sculpturatus]
MIHISKYMKWRETGIAFEIRDGEYTLPNNTLASFLLIKHEGERYIRRGYWGDILTSPYIAYGIECKQQEFLEKRNRMYTKTSQDISYHNTLAMFHELIYDEHYKSLNKEQLSNDKENVIELKSEEIQTKTCDNPNTIEEKTDSSIDNYNIKFQYLEINRSEDCGKKHYLLLIIIV